MTGRQKLAVVALALLGLPWAAAQAGPPRVSIGIGFGVPFYPRPYYHPYYVAPYPYYVAPRPVYVVPAAPVYVQPAPAVYQVPAQPVAPVYAPAYQVPAQPPTVPPMPATNPVPAYYPYQPGSGR
jgi:hypothetical protein